MKLLRSIKSTVNDFRALWRLNDGIREKKIDWFLVIAYVGLVLLIAGMGVSAGLLIRWAVS